MSESDTYNYACDVAIIGMAGRYPGAKNVEELWQNLVQGVESITFFSNQEVAVLDPALLADPNYVKAWGVLDGVELFDAAFFDLTPEEVTYMDPQHRIFLECAWEALENAGYAPEMYPGRIGVFAGAGASTYEKFIRAPAFPISMSGLHTMLGNQGDYLTTRVSFKLNLRGPSLNVQTACCTSLTAVHLAYQSLLNHECDMALAGGVAILLPQNAGYVYQEGGFLPPDGHCRAFDAKAQGAVGGNGASIVALKRLKDALADGDCVYAVIKGSALNNDGSQKVRYIAPGVDGQAAAIAEALAAARVDPETISYVEAHGVATILGDPNEMSALTRAFRAHTQKKQFCAIGSVKTNVGHLGAAASVTSLIKAALALKHKKLPASLHFEQPNPQIDFANSPFYVNTRLSEWQPNGTPLRAGVNAFGLGGTNVFMVLQEAPVVQTCQSRPWQLLVLSAKTNAALNAATSNLARYLRQHPDICLANAAYTLQMGRQPFSHRRAVVCRGREDAVSALETCDSQQVRTDVHESDEHVVVFLFPDLGAQHVNMALELYQTEPTFRAQVDLCSEFLIPHLGFDLRRLLYPREEGEAAQLLGQSRVAQPALFVIEYALSRLWMEWGIRPQTMIGCGVGEYVAACLADVFTWQDALRLIAARGRLMQMLPKDTVQSVRLQAAETDMASFAAQIGKVSLGKPSLRYLSSVTGDWITLAQATDPAYWVNHARQATPLTQHILESARDSGSTLLEVGPDQVASTFRDMRRIVLPSLRHADGLQSDAQSILNSLGYLWLAGVSVNWRGFYTHERRQRVPLPTYPFERQRYWVEP